MAHQDHHQVAELISEDPNDDRRLYECAKKYETIVKQFGELMGIMSNVNAVPKTKWRKSRRGNGSGGKASVSSIQPKSNEALVQTVTRFLHELGNNPTDSE